MQRCLSGSSLKLIAAISMLVDHSARVFLSESEMALAPWFSVGNTDFNLFYLLRGVIGRMAFPLFAFLLTEGFAHTHNRLRYGLNLLLFALLSEPIWDLLNRDIWFDPGTQNVLFTLFLGFLGMVAYDLCSNNTRRVIYLIVLWLLSYLLHADYSGVGVPFIVLLYALRQHRLLQFLVTLAAFTRQHLCAALAFIPISMYNGKRGFLRGAIGKYFFYLFYPGHLLVLWLLS